MTENGPPEQQEPEARGWGRGDVLAGAAVTLLAGTLKVPLDKDAWRARIWLFDDCDKAAGAPTTTTVTEIEGEETNVRTSVVRAGDSLPPEGWCWI